MKLKHIYTAAFVALSLSAVSCSVLDIDPNNKYGIDYGFKNRENVELYLQPDYDRRWAAEHQ